MLEYYWSNGEVTLNPDYGTTGEVVWLVMAKELWPTTKRQLEDAERKLNMKLVKLILLAGLWAVTPSTAVNAGNCARVQKAVVAEVAVAVPVVPLIQAVTIPLYNFSYSPQAPVYAQPAPQTYQQPVQAPVEAPIDCCAALVAELAKLRMEIANLRSGGSPAPLPSTPPGLPVGANLFSARCAACHTAGKEKGELAMFGPNGNNLPLSIQVKARAQRRILSSTMPPREKGLLPDTEKAALVEMLRGGQ